MNKSNLTNLDVDRLFEERSVDEIIELEKLLNVEIERKRNDLRSMVGDRYKDILAASDAIKSMKTISEEIVLNIEEITRTCELLIDTPSSGTSVIEKDIGDEKQKNEERILLIQVRLAIFLNEQIWIALDSGNNLDATQYYLLAQHIYIGLNITKKEYLGRLPLLEHLKLNLTTLRTKIFQRVTEKLESVEITPEEASQNLNALLLIENQTNDQLLSIFIEHRKTALQTVINTQYATVRVQIAAMVRCLITTVLLLHDCFIYTDSKNGLIWEELNNIVEEKAPTTLSKLELPVTPLVAYIPDIIKEFRPKLKVSSTDANQNSRKLEKRIVDNWLTSTREGVQKGLEQSLQLVTTIKGLYLVREESLKIEVPDIWSKICEDLQLPVNFDIWYYFFQNLMTARAESLISIIIKNSLDDIKNDIKSSLKNGPNAGKSETDLRWYAWKEDSHDVSRSENDHTGLIMKTKGFSQGVKQLCEELDGKFLELLEDVSQYLYGTELNALPGIPYLMHDFKFKRKFIDKEKLENHLMKECATHSLEIPRYVTDIISTEVGQNLVAKSLFFARFLQASCSLCDNFKKCCVFNGEHAAWQKVCDKSVHTSHSLWKNWVDSCVEKTADQVKLIHDTSPRRLISNLSRWDEIEIQEQTEEKVFKSQIKVPLKPSIHLTNLLVKLNQDLSRVLPYTLSKLIHVQFIEANVYVILQEYGNIASQDLNQIQALQYLLDVRFLTTLCVPRENAQMVGSAQSICDKLRSKIDPFDLDVFYSYVQNNVKKAVSQSQTLFGCLLPSTAQLMNLGAYTKTKEQEKNPSLMALSTPSSNAWFPLLPITVSSQKTSGASQSKSDLKENSPKPVKPTPKKSQDTASVMRQSAVSLFGNLTPDWFS